MGKKNLEKVEILKQLDRYRTDRWKVTECHADGQTDA
jgi:hypothetical protein